jgi:hypothetical protein
MKTKTAIKIFFGFIIASLILVIIGININDGTMSQGNVNKSVKDQKLLVIITDVNGNNTTSRIIEGNINDKAAIEQFAENLAKNPGYSYLGGSWNEDEQFIGIVNSPAGKMLIAIRVAD